MGSVLDGNLTIFAFCTACLGMALAYVAVRVVDVAPEGGGGGGGGEEDGSAAAGAGKGRVGRRAASVLLSAWDVLRVPFRRRRRGEGEGEAEGAGPIEDLLCLGFVVSECPFAMDDTLLYLYTGDRFGWTEDRFMTFYGAFISVLVVGQFVVMPGLVKLVKVE